MTLKLLVMQRISNPKATKSRKTVCMLCIHTPHSHTHIKYTDLPIIWTPTDPYHTSWSQTDPYSTTGVIMDSFLDEAHQRLVVNHGINEERANYTQEIIYTDTRNA